MLFSKQIKKNENVICDLDDKIQALQEKKMKLTIDIEKRKAEYDKISSQVKDVNDFLSLEEKIEISKTTVDSLNEEIENLQKELDSLKEKIKLKRQEMELICDYDFLNDEVNRLRESAIQLIDEKILEIKEKCPDVKLTRLDFSQKGIKDTDSVLYIIDAELIKFAIEHNIDPIYYKKIMYTYNSKWFKEFEKVAHKFNNLLCPDILDLIYHPLLKSFIILE